jgi:ferredoxin
VTFLPWGTRVEISPGRSVFDVGKEAGIPIPTACGAQANCGLCRVRILSGEAHLPPLDAAERKHLGNVYFINKLRLSCRLYVAAGDVTVELPDAVRPAS